MHWRPCSEPSTSRQWSTGIKLGRCSELLVLNMSRSLAPSVLFFSLYWGDLWNMLVQALLGISIHSWVSWPGLRKPCHAMPCHAWDHLRSLETTQGCMKYVFGKSWPNTCSLLKLKPCFLPCVFLLGRSHWKIARNRNPRCCLFSSTVEHSLTLHLRGHRPGIPSRLLTSIIPWP